MFAKDIEKFNYPLLLHRKCMRLRDRVSGFLLIVYFYDRLIS